MCLAIPMKLVSRRELDGQAELRGVRRQVNLMLVPEATAGNFVLVHAGYAIGTVDEQAADETLRLIDEAIARGAVPRDTVERSEVQP